MNPRTPLWLLLSLSLFACGGDRIEPAVPPGSSIPAASGSSAAASLAPPGEGEALWKSKCGACHLPVEPRSRTREVMVAAMGRHRKRLTLREPQWAAVTDFLSPP